MKKTLLSLLLICLSLILFAGVAGATNLFSNADFENNNTAGWHVYDTFGAWSRLAGQGIEVQHNSVATAHSGNQYIELDASPNHHVDSTHSGASNNSVMGQDIQLTAGTSYTISFWYQSRTAANGTNGISYGLWNNNSNSFATLLGTADDNTKATQNTAWTEITKTFTVNTDGTYTFAFAAVGTSDQYGGFIDDVSLRSTQGGNPVPIPAAAWLLGSGLLGLLGVRRRRT